MAIEFHCSACGKFYRVAEELAGRRAKCQCGERIHVPDAALMAREPEPPAQPQQLWEESTVERFELTDANPFANPESAPPSYFSALRVLVGLGVGVVGLLIFLVVINRGLFQEGGQPGPQPQVVKLNFKRPLHEQRGDFVTQLVPNDHLVHEPAPDPPRELMLKVYYDSPVGELVAYVTPRPADNERLPAVVWVRMGTHGLQPWLWSEMPPENDESVRSFLGKKLVVMCPSFRGENDNPGEFEFCFGEVDDLLAAGKYVANLPYVDSKRVYVAGHSDGGTLVMLAAASESPFRAAFVFGGDASFEANVEAGNYRKLPFDTQRTKEVQMRAPEHFAPAIRIPTFYFEGGNSKLADPAQRVARYAQNEQAPFVAHIITGGNHYDILRPLKEMIVEEMLSDTGEECSIAISQIQANEVYVAYWRGYKQRRQQFFASLPPVAATPAAAEELRAEVEKQRHREGTLGVIIRYREGEFKEMTVGIVQDPTKFESYSHNGIDFYYDPAARRPSVGQLLDWDEEEGFKHSDQVFVD